MGTNGGGDDALADLAAAVDEADRGRSLYETAKALARVVVERADPDEALRMLSAVRPRTWLRLDVELRSLRHFFRPRDEWGQITDAAWAGANPLALLLTACSGDGRQRQLSVQTPLMRSDQRLLPVLLIRTADWAKQVRGDAQQVLPAALDAADADGLLRATGVAMAMRDWQRGEGAFAAVTEALRTRSDGTLDAARMSDDVQVRRLAYRVWLESGHADSDALVAAALTEPDIICQSLSVDGVVRAAVRDRQRDALDRLLAARFARVRAEALAGLVQIGHPEAAEAFLADRSAMLRATAQWAMRRAGRDAAERYRAMLASGDDSLVRTAVAGLGECGAGDDAELVARYLWHDRPRVRAEAVRAVRRLGGALNQIARILTDPAPVVVRAAVTALRGRPDLPPTDLLWELLGADQQPHVRRAAFGLLVAKDSWIRIEADLWGVVDFDEKLRAYSRSDLTGWLDREASTAYQMPPQSTRERLGRLIDAAEPNIGEPKAHLLRWHLGLLR
ncbi:MAG TPA: HEAT repeat domain-containing protein [Mycobacterium sp.]|nr:HEAT repeat domain-containing protein [Mycobacterium sp.]